MPLHHQQPFGAPRRPARSSLAAGIALALLMAAPLYGSRAAGNGSNVTAQAQKEAPVALPSLAPLVQRVLPAVVSISSQLAGDTTSRSGSSAEEGDQSSSSMDDLLRRFFENRGLPQPGREAMALGSGFIIDPAGYVVTNNHVAGNSTKITVTLQGGSTHEGKVIGRDEKTDLALLKIDSKEKLPFV